MTDIRIGLLLFPEMTQLDLTGPYEVFRAAPGAMTLLLAKTLDPVRAAGGLRILPDTVLAGCPQLDVACVPGGPGVNAAMRARREGIVVRVAGSVSMGRAG